MKIYDCFSFYNEFDLLEIRLESLDHYVDYFVLTEAPVMFSGLSKPLYFEEHKNEARFKKFEHKIIHQILLDIPNDYVNLSSDGVEDELHKIVIDKIIKSKDWPKNHVPYGRDSFTKESSLRPLVNVDEDDIIMYSDCDEIPSLEAIQHIIDNYDVNEVYNLENVMYFYYFNILTNYKWYGTTISSFKLFKQNSICEARTHRQGTGLTQGGYHLSYMGGKEKVLEKMDSSTEIGLYTLTVKNNIQNNIDNCLSINHDIYGRPCKFKKVDINYYNHPAHIVNNQEKFKEYILQ